MVIGILSIHKLFQLVSIRAWECLLLLVHLLHESANGQLEQLVLSLRFQYLLVKKISLLLEVIRAASPFLDLFYLLVFFLFHPNLIIPNTLNSLLEAIDLLVLDRIVAVLLIELINQLPQFKLLSLHEDVVTLQVLVFLLCEHQVQFVIELCDLVVDLLFVFHNLWAELWFGRAR